MLVRALIIAVLTLAGCTSTQTGLGVSFGPDGTTVTPSFTGTSGNATLSIGG